MKKDYIFTNGKHPTEEGFRWYIDQFETLEQAEQAKRDGWIVNLYTSTKQYMGYSPFEN